MHDDIGGELVSVQTLVINGLDVAGDSDQTILDVARENSIHIPTLCHLKGLSDVGACRLCVVEVAGSNKLFAACVTTVSEGMSVVTDSPRLQAYRKTIIEMLFMERNHVCSVCVANNHCELQRLAKSLGLTHFDLPPLEPKVDVDASHPRFAIDHNRCILCTRCVQGVRRDRRGPHLGRPRPRRRVPGHHRHGSAVGRVHHLHELRQMRPGLPDGRAVREGPGRGQRQA